MMGVAVLVAAGCGPAPAPPATESPPPAQLGRPVEDLRDFDGRSFADFVARHEDRFAPEALGLSASDRARLWRVMATSSGVLLEGGGAEALVFRGCADMGCGQGRGIVAIDARNGAVFIGVQDVGGSETLAPNDRIEALLRLNAPTRDWADAGLPEQPASVSPPSETP